MQMPLMFNSAWTPSSSDLLTAIMVLRVATVMHMHRSIVSDESTFFHTYNVATSLYTHGYLILSLGYYPRYIVFGLAVCLYRHHRGHGLRDVKNEGA